jgi:hypothetical protein
MLTMNTNEKAPDTFYVFLHFGGLLGQMHKHNYQLAHKIFSAGLINLETKAYNYQDFIDGDINYLPYVSTGVPVGTCSSFMMQTINNYYVEYCLEWFRKQNYKKYPSRFSGIYAFGDYESCEKVSQTHGWNLDSVKQFKLTSCLKIAKMNMEIVSFMRGIFLQGFSQKDQELMCKAYWDGLENFQAISPIIGGENVLESGCIYEYLIEGCLEEV